MSIEASPSPNAGPVLIAGAHGALGRELSSQIGVARIPVLTFDRTHLDASIALDALASVVEKSAPRAIVNCIALTGLDTCRRDEVKAFAINGLFANKLAILAKTMSIPTLQISTENVFAGDVEGKLYDEADTPAPTTIYGLSKLVGESPELRRVAPFYVLRLPLLFGPTNSKQIVARLVRDLLIGKRVGAASDIYSTPVYTPDVAGFIVEWLTGRRRLSEVTHLSSGALLSLYELISGIASGLGRQAAVEPVLSSAYPSLEAKPRFGGLKSRVTDLLSLERAQARYVDWIFQHEEEVAHGI